MKKNYFRLLFTTLCAGTLFLSSCGPDDDNQPVNPIIISPTSEGVLVTNEGNFMQGNGSVSYIDLKTKTVTAGLFQQVNNRPLGDVVQSLGMANNKVYVVVNNSNKIEITNANTFASEGVINNLKLPRYFASANGKGYVTEWVSFSGNGQVSVIDLANNTVTKTIPVGALPERMVAVNNKLYVVNSAGNTVSVINTQNDVVEQIITVGDAPNSLALDAANNLWVLCGGNKVYDPNTYQLIEAASTAGSLVRINLSSNAVDVTLPFASKREIPSDLSGFGAKTDFIYKYYGGVYRIQSSATSLPTTPLIRRHYFYGLAVDPNDNTIYATEAGNFSSNGKVVRFTPAGQAIDSFNVGIGPNNVFFK